MGGAVQIGWFQDGKLTGNGRKYNKDGKLLEDGWFREGDMVGRFDQEEKKYKYWDMLPKYF